VIIFLFSILFIYFSICFFEVKDLTLNGNNTGKLSVNELTMRFNVGSENVGTTINHPITNGIYKLYFYFCFNICFRKLKFTFVDMKKNYFSFFYLIFFLF
jgi:hypothetical protein